MSLYLSQEWHDYLSGMSLCHYISDEGFGI